MKKTLSCSFLKASFILHQIIFFNLTLTSYHTNAQVTIKSTWNYLNPFQLFQFQIFYWGSQTITLGTSCRKDLCLQWTWLCCTVSLTSRGQEWNTSSMDKSFSSNASVLESYRCCVCEKRKEDLTSPLLDTDLYEILKACRGGGMLS